MGTPSWPDFCYSQKASPPKKGGIGRFSMTLLRLLQGWHAPTKQTKTKIERQTYEHTEIESAAEQRKQ
jgi:hypothetical protein